MVIIHVNPGSLLVRRQTEIQTPVSLVKAFRTTNEKTERLSTNELRKQGFVCGVRVNDARSDRRSATQAQDSTTEVTKQSDYDKKTGKAKPNCVGGYDPSTILSSVTTGHEKVPDLPLWWNDTNGNISGGVRRVSSVNYLHTPHS